MKRGSKVEEEERHNVFIVEMGDFEKVLRGGSPRFERVRASLLSDEENSEINRVYFGNPFKILAHYQ